MLDGSQSAVVVGVGATLFLCYWGLAGLSTPKSRLPPGPEPLPILGNLLQLPKEFKERKLDEWGKIYGDIVYTRFLLTNVVILNSLEVTQNLLDKKSSIYSDRPDLATFTSFAGWENATPSLHYGDRHRKHRKWIHDAMGTRTSMKQYIPLQRREVYNLLVGLRDQPEAFNSHINRFTAAILVEITYGHTIQSLDDMYVELADKAMSETVEGNYPGLMLVDFISMPLLKVLPSWFPGQIGWFIRKASGVRAASKTLVETPYMMVKNDAISGRARPSLTASLLAMVSSKDLDDEIDIANVNGGLYAAGTETMVSTISTFFLTMAMYPHVFSKAKEEISRVVGSDHLPDFEDRKDLPYIECVLQEIYRWACPVPTGIFHRLMRDDEHLGYYIPGGSFIVANLWAMSRDERVYKNPDAFLPDRYMNVTAETAEMMDPRRWMFGFGRRVCPGRLLADTSIWLLLANVPRWISKMPETPQEGRSHLKQSGSRALSDHRRSSLSIPMYARAEASSSSKIWVPT